MPELPEIACRAREMKQALVGRAVAGVEVLQPKCLNVTVEAFEKGLVGASFLDVSYHGKWLVSETTRGYFLLNLGMGGEVLLVKRASLPPKWRVRLDFADGESLAIHFWWFGYAHYAAPGALKDHAMSAALGPNALDAPLPEFRRLLSGRRGRIKSFLLDQKRIAGIGNAYIHDILFRARLHPLREIPTMSDEDVGRLHAAIRKEFERSIRKGAAAYEVNLYGRPGGFSGKDLLVGYREGKPCPECGTQVIKLKTGSTSSFLCPSCQPFAGDPVSPSRGTGRRRRT
jgi:formamidopyrimidine-DNA glycosylase